MKKLFPLFFFSLPLLIVTYFDLSTFNNYDDIKNDKDSIIIINLGAVGDLMCHSVQYDYARIANDSFDFRPVYREVISIFNSFDFLMGNLETVLAGKEKRYSGYPFFNSPDDYFYALKDVGFNLLFTSNNHSLDKGFEGLLRTINIISSNDVHYNGTFNSPQDRDSLRIININGISIGFLSYSYGTNGLPVPKGKEWAINLIEEKLIINDINQMKSLNPDLIIVYFHFGEEYKRNPSEYQKRFVDLAVTNGADIIFGSHPHVIQTMEFKKGNGRLDSVFVAYSLGNFISNQQWRYSDAGVILNLNIEKHTANDSIVLSEVNFLPTRVYKGEIDGKREYLIIPENDSLSSYSFLTKKNISTAEEAFKDTEEIILNNSFHHRIKKMKLVK